MTADRVRRASLMLLFALTLFAGSSLLFLLEPMVGRMLLPGLGGAPAVWNTCLVFFQVSLLGGYLYARLLARHVPPGWQLLVHAVVVLLPFAVLPVQASVAGVPTTAPNPAFRLLGMLALSVGPPFLVVATTAPLLQQWFAHTSHPDAGDPYFLYQASNLGSFAALLAYPAAIEPAIGLRTQSLSWTVAYGVFAALVLACAYASWRNRRPAAPAREASAPAREASARAREAPAPPPAEPPGGARDRDVTWRARLRWTVLAAVPSSLLLGVTTYLSTDVAAVPLLWVVPLALYLLTFVAAFARRRIVSTPFLALLLPVLVLPLLLVLLVEATRPVWFVVLLHVASFVTVAQVCHRQLADERPDREHLTSFYLWMSVGGAAGGLFNAVAAPLLFRSIAEYPIALAAACFLIPRRGAPGAGRFTRADAVVPIAVGALTFVATRAMPSIPGLSGAAAAIVSLALPVAICFALAARPVRFGLAVAAVLAAGAARPNPMGVLLDTERSFFGVHRVVDEQATGIRWLWHGTTIHGGQSLAAGRSLEPLTYYTRSGPIGEIFAALAERGRPLRVAVVGLGAGGVASYSRAGDDWTYFEIDPVVVRLARDSGLFSFLRDSPASTSIVVGDGRLMLGRSGKSFDLILLDAFSSDAVPVHLLTREAVATYLARLAPGGWLVFNASNRHLAVHRVIADLAADAGLAHLWRQDTAVPAAESARGKMASQFAVVARSPEDFGALAAGGRWSEVAGPRGRVWTDDYANPFGILIW